MSGAGREVTLVPAGKLLSKLRLSHLGLCLVVEVDFWYLKI